QGVQQTNLNVSSEIHRFAIEPVDSRRFASLCGQFDEHLRLIEQRLGIEVRNRGSPFELIGDPEITRSAEAVLRQLYRETRDAELTPDTVHLFLQESGLENLSEALHTDSHKPVVLRTKRMTIQPRGPNQQIY